MFLSAYAIFGANRLAPEQLEVPQNLCPLIRLGFPPRFAEQPIQEAQETFEQHRPGTLRRIDPSRNRAHELHFLEGPTGL